MPKAIKALQKHKSKKVRLDFRGEVLMSSVTFQTMAPNILCFKGNKRLLSRALKVPGLRFGGFLSSFLGLHETKHYVVSRVPH